MSPSNIAKATPVLIVDSVEPCAKFWEAQGFTRVAEVPHEDTVGFVILINDTIELMYQSMESAKADDAAIGAHLTTGGSSLYVEVADLVAAVRAAGDAKVVLQERTSFYGMREVGVMDPGGNLVMFAQKVE